jgi:hypothetical protein
LAGESACPTFFIKFRGRNAHIKSGRRGLAAPSSHTTVRNGEAFKRHVTYPRTGFVAYPQTARGRMAPVVAAALAGAAALGAAVIVRGGVRMATLLGVVNLLFYAVAAQPLRPWKYGFLVLIAAGILWVSDAYAMLFFGLAFLVSGITTLTLYLRQTRAAQ